jgi:hypothetical protein
MRRKILSHASFRILFLSLSLHPSLWQGGPPLQKKYRRNTLIFSEEEEDKKRQETKFKQIAELINLIKMKKN